MLRITYTGNRLTHFQLTVSIFVSLCVLDKCTTNHMCIHIHLSHLMPLPPRFTQDRNCLQTLGCSLNSVKRSWHKPFIQKQNSCNLEDETPLTKSFGKDPHATPWRGPAIAAVVEFEGILPKGPYLPCVSMAGRALLVGYHRILICSVLKKKKNIFFFFDQFCFLRYREKNASVNVESWKIIALRILPVYLVSIVTH